MTITSTFAVCGAAPASAFASCGAAPASTIVACDVGAPTIISIVPSLAAGGSVVNVTIHGTNFVAGANVLVSGAGVVVSAIVVVDAFTITATFTIDALAAPGDRDVTVTTP